MRFATASALTGRLALAVVTEPAQSRPLPAGVREEAMRQMLQMADEAGVKLVATRPEGDVERLLGQAWPFPSPFRVSARTMALSEGIDRVEARARRSLERMGLPRGDVLLVENAADLAGSEGRALWDRLRRLKDRGLFRRIGFCAQVEDDPIGLARRLQPDVVQAPCNLLDQRMLSEGVIDALGAMGVETHLAAVFANGCLFGDSGRLPPELAPYAMAISRTRRRLAEARVDPMQAALAFALGIDSVGAVIISAASPAELRAMLAAASAPAPNLDWASLAVAEPQALTAAARTARAYAA